MHHAKAPFRLGLAGGGTDVSPYCDLYGGAVLNATINRFAHASIMPNNDGKIVFIQKNTNQRFEHHSEEVLPIDENFALQIGVYNYVVRHFAKRALSFELVTSMDVPHGSGLGTSSTLVVTILAAFAEWLKLPLGQLELAQHAYIIERIDLKMNGGRQDQYAAAFGGFNYIEFRKDGQVLVHPLQLKINFIRELSFYIVLFYMRTSRASAQIISKQQDNVREGKIEAIEATHALKTFTEEMKVALLKCDLEEIGRLMDLSWQNKKKLSNHITNAKIDALYEAALSAGSIGGKISGAGGGGFMMFCCPSHTRAQVIQALQKRGGKVFPYDFVLQGVERWTTQ